MWFVHFIFSSQILLVILSGYQAVFGKKSGTVIGAEIMKDCAKYQEGLTKASQSNVELHKVIVYHNSKANNVKYQYTLKNQ